MVTRFNKDDIPLAAELLRQGEIVAFPTETVYGLGASIFQPQAIKKIFSAKGRPQDNPLIAHVSDLSQIEQIAQEIPELFYRLQEAFFPGPLTCVLKKSSKVPAEVSAGLSSIALRMPSHPIARQLIECLGEPIVAPSANISGRPSATCPDHVLNDFYGKIAAVIDGGKTPLGLESTVVSLLGERPVLLRPGMISAAAIEAVIGQPLERPLANSPIDSPASPGMKYRHYAPKTPIHLFYEETALYAHLENHSYQMSCDIFSRTPPSKALPLSCTWKPLTEALFYAYLREADLLNRMAILIFCDAQICKNEALMNRITKAAGIYL